MIDLEDQQYNVKHCKAFEKKIGALSCPPLPWSFGDHMLNLNLVGPLNSSWQPIQLPVGMAMTKPSPLSHLHV